MLLLARSRTMSSLPLCIREARNKEPTQTEELMMANVHGAGINASTVFIGPKCFSTTTMTANPAITAKGSKRRASDERARNTSLLAVHWTPWYRRKALTTNQTGTAPKIKAQSKSANIIVSYSPVCPGHNALCLLNVLSSASSSGLACNAYSHTDQFRAEMELFLGTMEMMGTAAAMEVLGFPAQQA